MNSFKNGGQSVSSLDIDYILNKKVRKYWDFF